MNKIVEIAHSWLGTPYHPMARIKGAGVDCGQLCIGVYEEAGLVQDVKTGVYSTEWHLHRNEELYLNFVEKYCDEVEDMQAGDILLFQYGRCISHGGIYVGENKIIHAYVERGVILSGIYDSIFYDKKGRWRFRGSFRFRKGAK